MSGATADRPQEAINIPANQLLSKLPCPISYSTRPLQHPSISDLSPATVCLRLSVMLPPLLSLQAPYRRHPSVAAMSHSASVSRLTGLCLHVQPPGVRRRSATVHPGGGGGGDVHVWLTNHKDFLASRRAVRVGEMCFVCRWAEILLNRNKQGVGTHMHGCPDRPAALASVLNAPMAHHPTI